MDVASRYRGCLLGLACGDAVGTTVEFCERDSFPPVTDMVGGGPSLSDRLANSKVSRDAERSAGPMRSAPRRG